MTTTLNAATSAGFVVTPDTSGVLALQTAGTTALTIDASQNVSFTNQPTYSGGTANGVAYLNGSKVLTTGSSFVFDGINVGVGVTPTAWDSNFRVVQLSNYYASFGTNTTGQVQSYMASNCYYASSSWKGGVTGSNASLYEQIGGAHQWSVASTVTNGTNFTFTKAMTIDNSANVGIGTASPVLKLDVSGKVKFTGVEIAVSEDYTTNLYYSGGWKYRATGYGTTIGASSGAITFNNTASSGTADAAATLSERMRIDSSGNVGIGIAPTFKLDVWGPIQTNGDAYRNSAIVSTDTATAGYGGGIAFGGYYNGTSSYVYDFAGIQGFKENSTAGNYAGALRFTTRANGGNPTERMRIDSSGNVGIGATPTSPFTGANSIGRLVVQQGTGNVNIALVNNTNDAYTYLVNDGTAFKIQNSYNSTAGQKPITFWASGAENVRIDTSGNLLVGVTTAFVTMPLNLQGSSSSGQLGLRNSGATAGKYWTLGPNPANNIVLYNQSGVGVYIVDGGTSWTGSSDERLKTDLQPIENASAKVATLRAVTGRFKTDAEGVSRAFLIAQDVQAVLPEAVNQLDDEIGTLGLQYTDIIPLLVAAVKEQQALITQLQADVAALKGASA